ncbi:MAG: M23 family metallopeptidase [Bacillota bacterium]|nr:M23 family metallopeptidase [Bacillota bacterium]
MGSINDYLGGGKLNFPDKKPRRLLRQIICSAALIVVIALTVSMDNFLGGASRYVLSSGVDADNSWVDFEQALPALSENEISTAEVEIVEAGLAPALFTAPASGVVAEETTVDVSGFATRQGIEIQGAAGQSVKAAAAGQVLYLGESEDGYIVELKHSGGFTSVCQGLSEIEVAAGQQLEIGEIIGSTESGALVFSLFLDDIEVDPLDYLF